MHLKILGLSFVFLLIAIGCFVGATFTMKKYDYPDRNNKTDCEKSNVSKKGSVCGVWQSFNDNTHGQCRKGTVSNGKCVAKGHAWPLIFLIVGGICIIGFVLTFITGIL